MYTMSMCLHTHTHTHTHIQNRLETPYLEYWILGEDTP